jgi:hypothetical protein
MPGSCSARRARRAGRRPRRPRRPGARHAAVVVTSPSAPCCWTSPTWERLAVMNSVAMLVADRGGGAGGGRARGSAVVTHRARVTKRERATRGVPFPSPRGIRGRAQVGLSRRTEKPPEARSSCARHRARRGGDAVLALRWRWWSPNSSCSRWPR